MSAAEAAMADRVKDKTARAKARSTLGAKAYPQLEHQLDLYIIVGDDRRLVTVAHRPKRCKHLAGC
jgi:hypothetical protein